MYRTPVDGCGCALCEKWKRLAEEKAQEEYDALNKPDICPDCGNMTMTEVWEEGLQYLVCKSCKWNREVE